MWQSRFNYVIQLVSEMLVLLRNDISIFRLLMEVKIVEGDLSIIKPTLNRAEENELVTSIILSRIHNDLFKYPTWNFH